MDEFAEAEPEAKAGPTEIRRRAWLPGDPFAVVLGNASFLSVGYLLLGRWRVALGTWLITVALFVVLATGVRTVWFEFVVLGWWVVLIAHGWYLSRRQHTTDDAAIGGNSSPRLVRPQRSIALAVTIPLLLSLGLLRVDSALIDQHTTAARQSGNCAQAQTVAHRLWAGDYVGDAPTAQRGTNTVQACARLGPAADALHTALGEPETASLQAGFTDLSGVLRDLPGHERNVGTVLNGFLSQLPTQDACHTATITDWIGRRNPDATVLNHAKDVVPRVAPAAIVKCGDDLFAAGDHQGALPRYQQLLDQYPGDPLADKAKQGATKAFQAIQLGNVRQLLQTSAGLPAYCSNPAPYSGAAPYRGGHGPNHAMLFTDDDSEVSYADKFPIAWRANDAADAVVIICADKPSYGKAVQTCGYTAQNSGMHGDVTFSNISIPVHAYELRTAREIANTTIEIGGTSCPEFFNGYNIGGVPPPQQYVSPQDADVNAAFNSLINP